MKKSGKKLAIAAILAGSVIASASGCQQNVTVYGPPEDFATEDHANEANEAYSAEASEVSNEEASNEGASGEYNPDDNMIEDVYGPPMDYEMD